MASESLIDTYVRYLVLVLRSVLRKGGTDQHFMWLRARRLWTKIHYCIHGFILQ